MIKPAMLILCLPFLIAGCRGNTNSQKSPGDSSVNSGASTKAPDSTATKPNTISLATSTDKGADLIVKNDCRNCHREREKLVGPAFSDVAKRYGQSDIDSLAAKIIKGGSGHWGDAAMSPHPSLAVDDAKTIVKFILQYK